MLAVWLMQDGSSLTPCLKTRPESPTRIQLPDKGIHYCDQMFSLERSWKDLSAEERYKKRQSELKPLLKKFSDWCYKKSVSVLPSGKLGAYIVLMLPFLCINPLFCDYNWCNENCSTKGKRKLTPIARIN